MDAEGLERALRSKPRDGTWLLQKFGLDYLITLREVEGLKQVRGREPNRFGMRLFYFVPSRSKQLQRELEHIGCASALEEIAMTTQIANPIPAIKKAAKAASKKSATKKPAAKKKAPAAKKSATKKKAPAAKKKPATKKTPTTSKKKSSAKAAIAKPDSSKLKVGDLFERRGKKRPITFICSKCRWISTQDTKRCRGRHCS